MQWLRSFVYLFTESCCEWNYKLLVILNGRPVSNTLFRHICVYLILYHITSNCFRVFCSLLCQSAAVRPYRRLPHNLCLVALRRALTHWGRVTHICVSKLAIIDSDNGLSPGRCQAVIWPNAGILLIGPLGTKFNEISIEIHIFSFTKIHLKLSSGKWRPFCLGLNVLRLSLGHGAWPPIVCRHPFVIGWSTYRFGIASVSMYNGLSWPVGISTHLQRPLTVCPPNRP